MVIAAEWLKTVSRKGLGKGAFTALRAKGDTVFDDPSLAQSPILIAGRNFGCGSSREHAVWALLDLGVKAVIASGFSDIFSSNAFKNGLLTVVLDEDSVSKLLAVKEGAIRIDLADQTVASPDGREFPFDFDPFRKRCLLAGLDEISLTEKETQKIARFEKRLETERPFFAHAR